MPLDHLRSPSKISQNLGKTRMISLLTSSRHLIRTTAKCFRKSWLDMESRPTLFLASKNLRCYHSLTLGWKGERILRINTWWCQETKRPTGTWIVRLCYAGSYRNHGSVMAGPETPVCIFPSGARRQWTTFMQRLSHPL